MASKVLVVGSGAIGLRTAIELLKRNVTVSILSPKHPLHPSTCSMGAGGLWMPFHCDDKRTNRWALETLDELISMAKSTQSSLVETVPTLVLKKESSAPTVEDFASDQYNMDGKNLKSNNIPDWTTDPRLEFQHLTTEMLSWQNNVHKLRIPNASTLVKAGYDYCWFFKPPIVDTTRMLKSMLDEIQSHPNADVVNVDTGIYYDCLQDLVDETAKLGYDAVVNCTGLGSKAICDDDSLIGARGILLNFDRKCERLESDSEIELSNDAAILVEDSPFGVEDYPCYLIPRGDKIVVGGSYIENDTLTYIRDAERTRLTTNARLLGIDTSKSKPLGEWTGFRPYRSTVRLERDTSIGKDEGITLVHNYGHGGSGWTVFIGAATEVTSLLVKAS